MSENNGYEYLLGDGAAELERLQFQHSVWGPVTDQFFDRIGVGHGWRCLDVGAGPGLVTMDLRRRVGGNGEVIALEPSSYFRDWLNGQIAQEGWKNVSLQSGTSYEAALPHHHFDLVFIRWVIGFVPSPESFLSPLISALKPGGIIAVQDYVHEGCALFPEGSAWDRFPELMRQWWRSGGGDPYVGARLPAVFRSMGLQVIDYTPTSLSGGPDSRVMEWMGRFMHSQLPVMVERKLATQEESDAIRADWQAHRRNPDTIFFSPFVIDVAAQTKP
ncbi:MAG: methyltransferase domain-containing protein [Candidatus Zixiibacteriota bacterium]